MNFADNPEMIKFAVSKRLAEVRQNGWRPTAIILNPITWDLMKKAFKANPALLRNLSVNMLRGLEVFTSDIQPTDTFKLAEIREL